MIHTSQNETWKKGCDNEFIHIDPDEADLRDKYAACLWIKKWKNLTLIMISKLIS